MVNPHSINPQKYVDNMSAGSGDILEYRLLLLSRNISTRLLSGIYPECYLKSKDLLLIPVSGVKRALITRVISSLKLVFNDIKEVNLIPLNTEFINPPDVRTQVSPDWLKSLVIDITSESDLEELTSCRSSVK
jgi:hypothetical protein